MMRRPTALPALLLAACGSGTWTAETWGEEFIEEGLPAEIFADGCSARFDRFEVSVTEAALLDGNDAVVASAPAGVFDLTQAGAQTLGSGDVPAGTYTTARFAVAPGDGPSLSVAGSVTCGADEVMFDWTFDTTTTYLCEPEALTIPAGGKRVTQLTIHGDHFFYDGLENPDAEVRGLALVEADADEDGTLTQVELDAVQVATLGYAVGSRSDVTSLGDFLAALTETLGHVDGEGHCQVNP